MVRRSLSMDKRLTSLTPDCSRLSANGEHKDDILNLSEEHIGCNAEIDTQLRQLHQCGSSYD